MFDIHRFLLDKRKSSGIDGAVLNWIKSYLSNRSYPVQIDGVLSEEAPCHRFLCLVPFMHVEYDAVV